jgi:four helix bundle protein
VLSIGVREYCGGVAQATHPNAFVSKLNDAEAEASETEVCLELAVRCGYLDHAQAAALDQKYESILAMLVTMISHPEQWTIRALHEEEAAYA